MSHSYESIAPSVSCEPVLEAYQHHPTAQLETYKFFNQTGKEAQLSREQFNRFVAEGRTESLTLYAYGSIAYDTLAQCARRINYPRRAIAIRRRSIQRDQIIGELRLPASNPGKCASVCCIV